MKMITTDKGYLTKILKNIYTKKTNEKELEVFISNRLDKKNQEESLGNLLSFIQKEILSGSLKQYLTHGNFKAFEYLFYIMNLYKVSDKLYFNIFSSLLNFLVEKNENEKNLIIGTTNTIIKFIKGKRTIILVNFQQFFEKLVFLCIHHDKDIRSYGYALDESLKDEISDLYLEDYTTINKLSKLNNIIEEENTDNMKFPMKYLIKMWEESIHPGLKVLIISWITFLESIPEIKLIDDMNLIINNLFNCLRSNIKDVKESSEHCLKKILWDLENQYEILINDYPHILSEILDIIIRNCLKIEIDIKEKAFQWLLSFLKEFKLILMKKIFENDDGKKLELLFDENSLFKNYINGNSTSYFNEEGHKLDSYKSYKEIVHKNLLKLGLMEKDELKKKISIDKLIQNIPHKLFPHIINALINSTTCDNNTQVILDNINLINQIFKYIIEKYPAEILESDLLNFEKVFYAYINRPLNNESISLLLDWTNQLYIQYGSKFLSDKEDCIKKLINIIPNYDKSILVKIISTICLICDNQTDYINISIDLIIGKLNENKNLINLYGFKILQTLSKTIDIFIIYKRFCENLLKHKDIKFVIELTEVLNKFLLLEKKSDKIRIELSKKLVDIQNPNEKEKEYNLFEKLFNLWAFSPFTAVLFAMYSNHFELSYYLTIACSQIKLNENDYVELFKIVQIFESSLFNCVRIQLLRPRKNIYLVKTLNALLTLLPQSNSFDALNNRIKCVKALSIFDDDEEDIHTVKDRIDKINKKPKVYDNKAFIDKYINLLKSRYNMKIK